MALAALTMRQVEFWRDSASLFIHTVAVTRDNAIVKYMLARIYLDAAGSAGNEIAAQQYRIEAEKELLDVVRVRPDRVEGRTALGQLYLSQQRWLEARAQWQAAVALEPQNAEFYNTLGYANVRAGLLREAEESFATAVRLDPENQSAVANLLRVRAQEQAQAASASASAPLSH